MARIAYVILPIKNKIETDWKYGLLVPEITPLLGGVCATLFMRSFFGIKHNYRQVFNKTELLR
ncbi:MAG: hypothetical protein VB018_05070 [Lachnospiraceae bacterium]|nr:hypothetical protein [Lachnospiraceae bacterium]